MSGRRIAVSAVEDRRVQARRAENRQDNAWVVAALRCSHGEEGLMADEIAPRASTGEAVARGVADVV